MSPVFKEGDLMPESITIYTDGACRGNPGPGGYGVIICGDYTVEMAAGYARTTNNRMEMMAVIVGLEAMSTDGVYPIGTHITVFSDSKYVVDAINKGWARRWRANGWVRNKQGDPALNPDLWGELLDLYERLNVEFKWVRGHSGDPLNERADELAVAASHKPNLPEDRGYAGYVKKRRRQ